MWPGAKSDDRRVSPLLAVLPIVAGVLLALPRAWVCDDAFISFRYVDHLASGYGLVYNPGERVEGYTHFLWVVLLAAGRRAGLDLVELGRYLPIVFHAGTLALLCRWSRRLAAPGRFFLPLAATAVALHPDMQIWASGGLETAAFTFCVTGAVLAAASPGGSPGRVAALAGLATLFRPEGLLLTASLAAVLFWQRRGARALLAFALVSFALLAPLVAWRAVYYHDWLPNTYYAKSAGAANWERGWHYVRLYFAAYPILVLAVIAALVGGWVQRRDPGAAVLPCAVSSALLLVYVVRVGGDFMFARFLVPITPLLYIVLEEVVRPPRTAVRHAILGLVVAATVGAGFGRDRILADGDRARGVVDEHRYYQRSVVELRRRQGDATAAILRGVRVGVCALGGQAGFAYFARFPYVFERYGLTDREFARRPVGDRGRPGHERGLSRQDLVARRVHFIFRGGGEARSGAIDEVALGDLVASVVFYDRAVMDSLRGRPAVAFVDYPAFLDSIAESSVRLSPEARRSTWAFANGYYFEHNLDPERYERTRAALLDPVGEGEVGR